MSLFVVPPVSESLVCLFGKTRRTDGGGCLFPAEILGRPTLLGAAGTPGSPVHAGKGGGHWGKGMASRRLPDPHWASKESRQAVCSPEDSARPGRAPAPRPWSLLAPSPAQGPPVPARGSGSASTAFLRSFPELTQFKVPKAQMFRLPQAQSKSQKRVP